MHFNLMEILTKKLYRICFGIKKKKEMGKLAMNFEIYC